MYKIFLSFAVDMSGVDRTQIKATIQRATYQAIMKRCRCCFQIGSLVSSWFQHRVHGTIISWVCI